MYLFPTSTLVLLALFLAWFFGGGDYDSPAPFVAGGLCIFLMVGFAGLRRLPSPIPRRLAMALTSVTCTLVLFFSLAWFENVHFVLDSLAGWTGVEGRLPLHGVDAPVFKVWVTDASGRSLPVGLDRNQWLRVALSPGDYYLSRAEITNSPGNYCQLDSAQVTVISGHVTSVNEATATKIGGGTFCSITQGLATH
jgi:hypothetical protein